MGLTALRTGARWLKDPWAVLRDMRDRHGPTFRLELPILGEALFTGDPALVREIARHDDLDAGRGIRALRAVLGDRSLITLDGDAHRARQRIVHPPLHDDLERWDAVTDASAARVLSDLPNGPLSAYELALTISRRCIVTALVGRPDAETESLVDRFLRAVADPLVLYVRPLRVDLGALSAWGRLQKLRRRLQVALERAVADALPGAIVAALAESLSCDELVDEVLALLVFGHDTGAAQLSWAVALTQQHPDAVARAIEDEAFATACLYESMRQAPVVPHLTRIARRDTTVGPHAVAADSAVLPSAWLAHHHPATWPDPDRFDPTRFPGVTPSPFEYFPFGIGARICVGRSFVLRQMRRLLPAILRATQPVEGYVPTPRRKQVLMVPADGGRVQARR